MLADRGERRVGTVVGLWRDEHVASILAVATSLIAVLLWRAGPGFALVTGGTVASAAILLLTMPS